MQGETVPDADFWKVDRSILRGAATTFLYGFKGARLRLPPGRAEPAQKIEG
jgi:hypothetical protein